MKLPQSHGPHRGIRKLKIKIKSLAEEARIIRKEEEKAADRSSMEAWRLLHDELHRHRVLQVRCEARAAQLAYGFLRGKNYMDLENQVRDPVSGLHNEAFRRAAALVKKYGTREQVEAFSDWEYNAKAYIKGQNIRL